MLPPDVTKAMAAERHDQWFLRHAHAFLQAGWLPEIQRMVKTVNSHFQRMLSGMGCNSQVSLYCGCPEFNGCNAFDKYAIHIRVKFRDEEELQLLTANRQSGGERAVCTILYIVALQVKPC